MFTFALYVNSLHIFSEKNKLLACGTEMKFLTCQLTLPLYTEKHVIA
jgi:hypothetical protein